MNEYFVTEVRRIEGIYNYTKILLLKWTGVKQIKQSQF